MNVSENFKLCLQNSKIGFQQSVSKKKSRLINEQTIKHFQTLLKDETWDTVYKITCINEMYNRFQGIFLRHYEARFPVFYTNYRSYVHSFNVCVPAQRGQVTSPLQSRNLWLNLEHLKHLVATT